MEQVFVFLVSLGIVFRLQGYLVGPLGALGALLVPGVVFGTKPGGKKQIRFGHHFDPKLHIPDYVCVVFVVQF